MLVWLVLIPLVAALLIGICKAPAKVTSLLSAIATLILGITAICTFDADPESWTQLAGLDLQFTLAPALAKVMILLTVIVTFATVVGTKAPLNSEASWYNSALLISAGATGAFLSNNIIAFFAFHELALIPTFVMVGLYGRGDKRTIAWRATVYLGAASMVLLTALLMIATQLGYTFTEITASIRSGAEFQYAVPIGAMLLAGFGTLVSLFPFHSWAGPLYASAPAPVAMMHAGVLKKFGLYGLFMFSPLISDCFKDWNNLLMILLVGNIIWVGYVTVNQKRLDLMLGHSSVMHMGYIFLAFAALVASNGCQHCNPWAIKGAALLMLAHGLSIALLFLVCGQIEAKAKTLELGSLGGLGQKLPRLCFIFGLAGMASIGLPGLANFAGEFAVFFSAFATWAGEFGPLQIAAVFCLWGLVISAVYMLRAYRSIFLGDISRASGRVEGNLNAWDYAASVILCASLIFFGFFPNTITSLFPW